MIIYPIKYFLLSFLGINKGNLDVGNDADLVVMAAALGDVDNIYILLRDVRSYKLFDLDSFLLEHSKQYMGVKEDLDYYQNFYYLRSDFAVLSIMMGNDYIPRVCYAKFDKIWETYRRFRPYSGWASPNIK